MSRCIAIYGIDKEYIRYIAQPNEFEYNIHFAIFIFIFFNLQGVTYVYEISFMMNINIVLQLGTSYVQSSRYDGKFVNKNSS